MDKKVVLLDLNYTLVENSQVHNLPRFYNVHLETYRQWLIEKVREHYVILITVRPESYKDATLKRIKDLTGWQPQEAYFNRWFMKAAQCKEKILMSEGILMRFPRESLIAIESNQTTRSMYDSHQIAACRHDDMLELYL